MKVFEIIELSREILKALSKHDIRTTDVEYVEMYRKYMEMKRQGIKVTYIVSVLAEECGCSESSIYRMLRRFGETVSD